MNTLHQGGVKTSAVCIIFSIVSYVAYALLCFNSLLKKGLTEDK